MTYIQQLGNSEEAGTSLQLPTNIEPLDKSMEIT